MSPLDDDTRDASLTRREALRRAAALGGAIAWTVPLVQTIDVRAAAASVGSPRPDAPAGTDGTPPTGTSTTPPTGGGGGVAPAGGGGAAVPSGTPQGSPSALQVRSVSASPNPFDLSRDDAVELRCFVTGASVVRVTIMRNGRLRRQLPTRRLTAPGWVQVRWREGNVPPGSYQVLIRAEDASGDSAEGSVRVRVRR